MEFGTPQALWLFLVLPFFLVLHYRSFSDMGVFQRRFSLFLRLVLLTSLILALADTRLIQRSDKLSVIFLWDASQSMGEASEFPMWDYIHQAVGTSDKEDDSAALIAFGREAYFEAGLGTDLSEISDIETEVSSDFTDLQSALDLAIASLPSDTGTRIVLLSDGNENIGDALSSARIAANRGVQINVVPFGEPAEGEVSAGRIILPRRVEEGEMFDVRAVIDSDTRTEATVEVYENGQLIGGELVALEPGKNVFTFPQQHNEGGFYSYEVKVSGVDSDVSDANNRAIDYTIVEGQPKVAYVSGDTNEQPYLVNSLRDEGIQAVFRDMSGLPTSLVSMAQYDAIFFSDVGAENLMPDTMAAYQAYVRDLGNGFVMVGGENSFGPGGYYKTPVEDILPVSLDLTKKEFMPTIAIALVIDKSGSMGAVEADGSQKISIAREACQRTAELLDYTDQIGVYAFDSMAQPIIELGPVEDLDAIRRQIGTIRAGGGTAVYPGMHAAFVALENCDAKIKHMIVLSDGMTAPGDFEGLMDRISNDSITVSTVSVGSNANVQLMGWLAGEGGGNHYVVNSLNAVPQIFTKETFLMSNRALVEEPFVAAPNMQTPVTDGIDWSASPPLLGYVATEIKPLAVEGLVTHKVDPLLAHWQYGLGRSLAFTSDAKSHWAASWLNWGGYEQFWTQATRWLVGVDMQGNLVPNIFIRGGQANISVDAIDANGEMITDAIVKARVIPPDFNSVELDLFQVAPGRYQAQLPATQIGSYLVNIFQENDEGNVIDQVSSGFSVSYPPEYDNSGPDMFLLTQIADITGGVLNPETGDIFRHTNQPVTHYQNLWYYLLVIFICVLPLDIAFRRLSFTGETLETVRSRILGRYDDIRQARLRGREQPVHIKELRKVKEQYRLQSKADSGLSSDQAVEDSLKKIKESTRRRKETGAPPIKSSQPESTATKKPPEPSEESSLDRLKKAKKRTWDK
jgi:uncharacterized membrane protein